MEQIQQMANIGKRWQVDGAPGPSWVMRLICVNNSIASAVIILCANLLKTYLHALFAWKNKVSMLCDQMYVVYVDVWRNKGDKHQVPGVSCHDSHSTTEWCERVRHGQRWFLKFKAQRHSRLLSKRVLFGTLQNNLNRFNFRFFTRFPRKKSPVFFQCKWQTSLYTYYWFASQQFSVCCILLQETRNKVVWCIFEEVCIWMPGKL